MNFRACLLAGLAGLGAAAADKALPNQAGNATVSLQGMAVTDRKAIAQLLGVDLGDGWVVVKIRVLPETPEGLRVSIDDFTLVSRKDGEKSGALAPSQIAGGTALVVGPAQRTGGGIGAAPAPNIGVGGIGMPPSGGGIGAGGSTDGPFADVRVVNSGKSEDPRLGPLEARMLREQETKQPVEGLLYFALERKVKPKDVGLIYFGPGGRLVMDFK
jgi:hypothetical protein